jgi:hypothetical protein
MHFPSLGARHGTAAEPLFRIPAQRIAGRSPSREVVNIIEISDREIDPERDTTFRANLTLRLPLIRDSLWRRVKG